MQQLTKEETAKVFAMYIGQQVQVPFGEGVFYRELLGVIETKLVYQYDDDDLEFTSDIGKWDENGDKLCLIPLDKITDEHAIEVAEIETCKDIKYYYPNGFEIRKQAENSEYPGVFFDYLNNGAIDCPVRIYTKYLRINIDGMDRPLSYKSFQHLVSNGYSVPLWFGINHWANGKTPIELGIAIEST